MSKASDIMKKERKLFGFQKYTIIMCIAGIGLIFWSQLPGGYEVFTEIFMGLGTGILGGCILFIITGKKSKESYELEEQQLLLHEIGIYIDNLYDLQYLVSGDKTTREQQYRDYYGKTVYQIECMVRRSSVNVSRIACSEKLRICVKEMTGWDSYIWSEGALDLMVWHEEILAQVEALNETSITSEAEAEEYYQFISAYKSKVIDLKRTFSLYRDKIDREKARIAKSII